GIEADGTIKGCPSLATSTYAGGNIRDLSFEQIWWESAALNINRGQTSNGWGFCGSCYYADVCKAGCTWTTHSLLGKAGNNPYCHHRALELSKHGLRERIVQVEKAPGTSFDHGRFELILETLDGKPTSTNNLVQIKRTSAPVELILCRVCNRHVKTSTQVCPFCTGDIRSLANHHEKNLREAKKAYRRL